MFTQVVVKLVCSNIKRTNPTAQGSIKNKRVNQMQYLNTTFSYFIEWFSQTLGYAKNLNLVNNIKSIKSQ